MLGDNKKLEELAVDFLLVISDNCQPSQLVILRSAEIMEKLISRGFGDDSLFNIVQHPDVKLHFPISKFLLMYSRHTTNPNATPTANFRATSVYSLVCDTDSGNAVELTNQYINTLSWQINGTFRGLSGYSLYELIMPLVNLSVNNGNKDLLGEGDIIRLMLQTLKVNANSEKEERVAKNLLLSKQSAAKVCTNETI